MLRAARERLDQLVQPVRQVLLGRQDQPAELVLLDPSELLALRARQEPLVRQDNRSPGAEHGAP